MFKTAVYKYCLLEHANIVGFRWGRTARLCWMTLRGIDWIWKYSVGQRHVDLNNCSLDL